MANICNGPMIEYWYKSERVTCAMASSGTPLPFAHVAATTMPGHVAFGTIVAVTMTIVAVTPHSVTLLSVVRVHDVRLTGMRRTS